jgi:transposase
MASPKRFTIKETLPELRRMQRTSSPMMAKRLHAMVLFKKHEATGISKREAARQIGCDPNSVRAWREAYIGGGIGRLLSHAIEGNHPSVIGPEQAAALRAKLHDPNNGIRGYVELLGWYEAEFGQAINYKTLNGFVHRKYGALCKTARKSHKKADPEAVAAFKKTSSTSARR